MTTHDRLIMMANQIAAHFAMEVDPAGATAEHINLFWDARMKSLLIAGDSAALSPAAAAALDIISKEAVPQ